jgi:hypothetical protein
MFVMITSIQTLKTIINWRGNLPKDQLPQLEEELFALGRNYTNLVQPSWTAAN